MTTSRKLGLPTLAARGAEKPRRTCLWRKKAGPSLMESKYPRAVASKHVADQLVSGLRRLIVTYTGSSPRLSADGSGAYASKGCCRPVSRLRGGSRDGLRGWCCHE